MTLVAAVTLQAGQSQVWQKVCAWVFHPRTSLLRVPLWQRWDEKQLSGQERLLRLSGSWYQVKQPPARLKCRGSHRLLRVVADTSKLGITMSHHPVVLQQVHLCGEQWPRAGSPKLTPQHTEHSSDVNPRDNPPLQAFIWTLQGRTAPRGPGARVYTVQHGQPMRCPRNVTMVLREQPRCRLAPQSCWALLPRGRLCPYACFTCSLWEPFCALFPFQISSLQVTESPLAYKALTKRDLFFLADAALHAGGCCTGQPITAALPSSQRGLGAVPPGAPCCSSWSETLPSRCCFLGPSFQHHEVSSWQHLPQRMEKVKGKSIPWPCARVGNNLVATGTSTQDGVRMVFISCEQLCDPPGHVGLSAWATGRRVPVRWDGPRGQRDTGHPAARLTAR